MDPTRDDAATAVVGDGLTDILRSWESASGAMSPGGIEPAIYLDQSALDDLYRVNVYAQRICDAMPDEALRRGWEVSYGEQDGDERQDPVGDELWRVRARELFCQAGKLARKDGLAALYIGAWDGQTVDQPLDLDRLQKVTHLTLVEREQIVPHEWENDFVQPGFGQPKTYLISPYSAGGSAVNAYVHASRLLLFGGKWLPPRLQSENNNAPDSVLQRCWRLVQDFRRTETDIGAILRSFSHGSLSIPDLPAKLSSANKSAMLERLSLLSTSRSVFGLALIGKDESINYVTRSVAGLSDLYDRLAQGLAAAAEMPLTLLFGHSPSGLSTDDESGRTYWNNRVAAYQQHDLQPHLERLGRMLAVAKQGPCKGEEPEQWELNWLPPSVPTEAERVQVRASQASTDKTYWEMGVLSEKEIRASRFGRGQWSSETALIEGEDPSLQPDEPLADPAAGPGAVAAQAKQDAEAAVQPADYFRNVGGQTIPFVGEPGEGSPLAGNVNLLAAVSKGASPEAKKKLAAWQKKQKAAAKTPNAKGVKSATASGVRGIRMGKVSSESLVAMAEHGRPTIEKAALAAGMTPESIDRLRFGASEWAGEYRDGVGHKDSFADWKDVVAGVDRSQPGYLAMREAREKAPERWGKALELADANPGGGPVAEIYGYRGMKGEDTAKSVIDAWSSGGPLVMPHDELASWSFDDNVAEWFAIGNPGNPKRDEHIGVVFGRAWDTRDVPMGMMVDDGAMSLTYAHEREFVAGLGTTSGVPVDPREATVYIQGKAYGYDQREAAAAHFARSVKKG